MILLPIPTCHDMYIEVIKRPKFGKPIKIVQKAHSPLKNWGNVLDAYFEKQDRDVVDLTGASKTIRGYIQSVYCNSGYRNVGIDLHPKAGEGDDSFGLIVGKGTASVTFDDYNLASRYTHGEGENQLYHYGTTISLTVSGQVTIDDKTYNTMILTVERAFQNKWTDSQTITEIGLALYYYHYSVGSCKFLAFRDVLDQSITLASSETATLRYHFRWLLPA